MQLGAIVRDRYEVLRLLGQGGMGAVYAVLDKQSGVERALKELGSDQGALRVAQHRFKREFSTISRLQHPNIVQVTDFGEASGALFYVMELLTGTSLQSLIPRPAELPDRAQVGERLRSLSGVIEALGYIHQQHLVHRDLKPSNLIFSQDGKLKVTDFGLAKDFDNAITLTESGAILGTLSHMAPEQLQGRKIDHRADLYALGVLLYQMMTARIPFPETNPLALMRQQVTQVPLAPSRHNPAIPRELDDVILKLLSRDPADRYANAGALLADLAAVSKGETPGVSKAADGSSELRTILQTAAGYVGRQEDLQRMQKSLEEAGAGQGGVVLITGEAGIGKTRFVEEFCARALLFGVTFLKGRADRRAGVYYRPFIEMIEGYNARLGQYDAETEAAVFADIGRVLARLVPRLMERKSIAAMPEPPALEPRENKVRLFDAVTRFFLRLAQQETLVLFFDDIQHIDELSLELFQYLGRNARAARMVLVAAVRGEDLSPRDGKAHPVEAAMAHLKRESVRTETIALKRLSESETHRMARALAGRSDLAAEFLNKLWARTAGVPYFIEELMRWLREQGSIESGVIPEEMPETVEAVLRERLEGIPEATLASLRAAAVVGEEFEFEVLMRATGEPEGTLLDAVDMALHMKVLKERPGERYAFVHPLLRMMLYSKLLPRKRRLLHQSVAKALEERGGNAAAGREAVEALAYHWTGAGEKDKALEYRIAAGRKAKDAWAMEAARGHFEQAARSLEEKTDPVSQAKLWDTLDALQGTISHSGSAVESGRLAERLVLLATQLSDRERKAKSLMVLASSENVQGHFQAALQHYKEALETTDSRVLKGQLTASMAFLYAEKLGRPLEGLPLAEEALKLAEGAGEDSTPMYSAMNSRGVALLRAGRFHEAETQMRATIEFAKAKGRRIGVCNGLNNLSVALEALGKLDERIAMMREAIAQAREIGYVHGECLYQVGLGFGLIERNDPDADVVGRQALELAKRAGYRTVIQAAENLLANLAYRRADFESVRKLLVATLADPELGVSHLVDAATLDAEAALHLGKTDEAIAQIESAAARIGYRFESAWALDFHLGRATILLDAGMFTEAATALERMESFAKASESRESVARFRFLKARLAAELGKAEEALALFKEATPVLYQRPSMFWRENYRVSWAAAMAKLGKLADARSAWERAETEFLRAGLQPWWQEQVRLHPQLAALAKAELEMRTEVRPAPPSGLVGDAPPLVGREAEMTWIREKLKSLQEKKEGSLVVWKGAAGIGRTRMLRELLEAADRVRLPAYQAAARSGGGSAHAAFLPLLRQVLDRVPAASIPRDVAAALRIGMPELNDHKTLTAAAPGDGKVVPGQELTPEQQRAQVHDAVARLFEAATGHGAQPMVLALDDAGSADEASLDLLVSLSRTLRGAGVLLAIAASSEDVADGKPLARRLTGLVRDKLATVRELHPLGARDLTAFVEAALGKKNSADLSALVVERSGGNPMFARELLLAMFRGGLVEDEEGGWRVKTRSLTLPDTIVGLLKHQLEGIEAESLRLLSAASVMGREFEFELLMDVASLEERVLLDKLEAIVRHGVLEAVLDDPLGRDLYRFSAPQMREVLYSGLKREDREALHRRMGDALERSLLNKSSVSAGELAHHYVLGHGGKKARDWSLEAGRKAARACANVEAVTHLENAIKAMKPDPALADREKQFEALVQLANIHTRTGDPGSARRRTEEALALAATPVEKLKVSRALAQALHRAGDLKSAVQETERAVKLFSKEQHGREGSDGWFQTLPPPDEIPMEAIEPLTGLLNTAAFDQVQLGDRESAARTIAYALTLADRTKRPEIQASVLRPRALLMQELGRIDEARNAHEKALRLWRAAGSRWDEGATLNNLAGVDIGSGNLLTGLENYLESARVFSAIGDTVEYARQLTNIGRTQFDLGQWPAAEVTMQEALSANTRLGEKRSITFAWADLARLHAARDEREKATTAATEGLRYSEESGLVQLTINILRTLVELCVRAGNIGGAREHGRKALAIATERRMGGFEAMAALDLVEPEILAGNVGEAQHLIEMAKAKLGPGAAGNTLVLRAEARLAEARGMLDDAIRGYGAALKTVEMSPNPLAVSMAQLDLGRALAASERRGGPGGGEAARPVVARAREAFARLGAKGHLARAEALLKECR